MAIYHCTVKIIGRSKGKSVIAAAAYYAGEKHYDRETGLTHDFTRKGSVVHREILLPDHAPEEYWDRQALWESVTKVEKKSNAQFAREVEVALPVEFSRELRLAVVREYVQINFVSSGSDIIFQENKRLKMRMAESEKQMKEIQDRAGAILSEAKKKEGNADRKLAKANQLMAEYQTALAKEVAQIKSEM